MRKNITCYALLLSGLVSILSCGEEDSECTYAKQIAVEEACYEPALGLTLVADINPDYNNLAWEIQVLSDTTTGLIIKDTQIIESVHETITIPDSVLLDYKHVKARVKTNCVGWYLYSKYFSFLRVKDANCTLWKQEDL